MYIRWQQRTRRNPQFGPWSKEVGEDKWVRLHDTHWSAIAVENKRINGKPTQRHIGFIVGFTESAARIDAQRCHLWDHICDRLDQLGNQITAADRKQIETAIAAKLPRPTPAQYKDIARHSAQLLGWKWITAKQKAALQDEAEQWQDHTGDLAKRINVAAGKISAAKPAVTCSFCGKSATQAHIMVAGSNANICDECIERAAVLVAERKTNPT
jgi:ClpX C4-type zinc finger